MSQQVPSPVLPEIPRISAYTEAQCDEFLASLCRACACGIPMLNHEQKIIVIAHSMMVAYGYGSIRTTVHSGETRTEFTVPDVLRFDRKTGLLKTSN